MLGDDVDERIAHSIAHRLRAAYVHIAAGLQEAPDKGAVLAKPILYVLAAARLLA